ncbi:MAG: hypothetical protein JRI23_28540 [Deltaproteobacteria bacterium]|nr:hypothetical protein [Deltaproteobacteria bacterium]MBW2536048.1 hypothetical protein [Deltaproteobacteria bacterium]
MSRRRLIVAVAVVAALALAPVVYRWAKYPPDTTPEGAYLRIASAIGRQAPEDCFAYLEEEAQHAVFTILRYGQQAAQEIEQSYPGDARAKALEPYLPARDAPGAPQLWAAIAARRGWLGRLRRDLSGVGRVEVVGERATVVTARGTRYPFRRRPNGIWGLTVFTADLEAQAERYARDLELIRSAAADYERGGDR